MSISYNSDFNESPAQLFDELREALTKYPDFVAMYASLASVLNKVLVFNTQTLTIRFSGAYAKLSYLLKQHRAQPDLVKCANDARIHIKEICDSTDKDTAIKSAEEYHLYDLAALCRLVALVYQCSIPQDLSDKIGQLPARRLTVGRRLEGVESLRCIVKSFDDRYIYAEADGYDEDIRVSYTKTLIGGGDDGWSYLKDLLKVGTQLNIVRPRISDNCLIADLIIIEPDYLVNISEVARCFTPYSDSHLNHLINKLRPDTTTEAMILGNFASQLLDEEINQPDTDGDQSKAYAESVMKFFGRNAFSMLATDISPNFHHNALKQRTNIKNAFSKLPQEVNTYDKSDVILEPSFLSPMLGLQGRIDLMQMDLQFLIEQKSGKAAGAFFNPEADPKPKEDHYVQILLYMMIIRYNYRAQYERNAQNLQSFLLYSKYDSSLCGVGFAPALMFKAIKMRNEMVAAEYRYADEGFNVALALNVDDFRTKIMSDSAWTRFFRPQIDAVLSPIKSASALERKYHLAMLRFVANEHLLSKVGSNQLEDHGLASIWLNAFDLKLNAGNIYAGMHLVSPTPAHQGSVAKVVLGFEPNADCNMSNFRKGDIVILYPYRRLSTPDASNTMIIRCSISDIKADTLELTLRAPQSDARIFNHSGAWAWAVEHDFMESSFAPLYRGVQAFLSANKARRDLLLMQRHPDIDPTASLRGEYGAFNTLAAAVKRAKDLFLIIGPPGTGKTSYGMLYTLKEQLLTPGTNVLITSYTNRAIDEICSKLVEENLDFIRLGSQFSTDPAYLDMTLPKLVEGSKNIDELRRRIMDTRIIVGTTTAFNSNLAIFALKRFDLAIVDEASQILEPHLLPILSAMHGDDVAVRKVVMIGDHKQLPAVVLQGHSVSRVDDVQLNSVGLVDCRLSLFERLLRRYSDDPTVTYMLDKQGRMHREIALFPNHAFYQGRLGVVPLAHQQEVLPSKGVALSGISDLIATRRLAFIAVDSPKPAEYVSDKVNMPEAQVIAALAVEIYRANKEAFDASKTVGIIVPYRNQITTVRHAIDRYGYPQLADIAIDTVERYQGSQRDYVIFGFTVQKFYQLQFLSNNTFEDGSDIIDRKLNVAMTRARKHLFMVGNPTLLKVNIVYQRLIEHITSHQGYFDVPVERFIKGDFIVDEYRPVSDGM